MKKRTIVAVTAVGGALLAGGLWLAGVWEEPSPRYWRIYAQSAQFFLAAKLPDNARLREYRIQLTRSALRTHPNGVTNEELEQAASLLERSSASTDAAKLLMALVRRESDHDTRKRHTEHALRLNESSTVMLNLIALNRNSQDERVKWTAQLLARFPAEPVGLALRCLDGYGDLAQNPPEVCAEVDWALKQAQQRHREYLRIREVIANYPAIAAAEIGKLQEEADHYGQRQVQYRDELAGVEREASQQGWIAAGEFILDLLPLPKDGDTLGSYVVREGACASKWINWLCAVGSAAKALSGMDQRKAALAAKANDLLESISRVEWLAQYDLSHINEWRSGKKLEEFRSDLTNQHRWFWDELDNEIFDHMPELGLDFGQVMSEVTGA